VRADKQRRIYELNPEGVKELADWIARIRAFWNPKLDALEEALKRESQ
jgi:DNA-binding PadR family transcriptional regulator